LIRFMSVHAAIICLVLLFGSASPVCAADPVKVEVTGIEGAAQKNVREALTLPYGLVRDGKVDSLWLDRFAHQAVEKARTALEPYGYYHAQVAVSIREAGKDAYLLSVAVVPGEPVRLTEVDVALDGSGEGEAPLRRLVKSFPLAKGSVLLQPEYERAKSTLKATAVELGYLDAEFSRHEIRIAPGASTARIVLTLQTGARYLFGEVRIEGAPEYPQPYLRRFFSFKKGEVFSYAKLGETQLNFSNSERFKSVIVTPEKEQAKDLQVPVLVKLVSASRRSLRPGVGYGTDTGARFTVHYRDLNLFRLGHDLDLSLYAAERLQGFAARYTIPDALDIKSSTTLQFNLQQEDVTTYVSRLAALELDRNRSLGRGELGTAYVKLQQENFTVGSESANSRLVLPGFRFSKEQFDNVIRPTLGYRYSLDLRGAHPYLGSDSGLVQFIAEGSALLPLPGRLSLHLRSKVGASLLADPLGDLPPSIRFFAGGDQSVRGFSYQSLGPRDASGQVVGGRNLLFGSVELERALYQNWGVSLFHDAGNAFNEFTNVHLFQGAGVGVHYYTPVGGLNLSLAKRLGTSENVYYIHFTVGFQL
jgi:translocation and assembly module TamA